MPRPLLAFALLSLLTLCARAQPAEQTVLFPGLVGEELREAIPLLFGPSPLDDLDYGEARDTLFRRVLLEPGDTLRCVYGGYAFRLDTSQDPTAYAFNEHFISTEHTYPQSKGAEEEPMRSDMHHLFPVRQNINASRGNAPYADIDDADTVTWFIADQSQNGIPAANIDAYSEKANAPERFEPREDHKGNAARAVFYFYTMFREAADAADPTFFDLQRETLLGWHYLDPADTLEAARNERINQYQGNLNPFVMDSTLARRAYFGDGIYTAPVVWINELHYDNTGTDTDEGFEIAGPAGASLDGWTVRFYNGSDNQEYAPPLPLSGALPDQADGFGALWFETVLQNGPDALALVSPAGAVAQFLSYESEVIGLGGPASGLLSIDLGVEESSTTAAGNSLQLQGTGSAYADFAWAANVPHSRGLPNPGQVFGLASRAGADAVPAVATLLEHFPNPFWGRTTIRYRLAEPAEVELAVFDLLGRRLRTLEAGPKNPGTHALDFRADGLPPGVYLYRLLTDDEALHGRMTVRGR